MSATHAAAPVSTDQSIRQSRIHGRPGPGLADGRPGRSLYRERATARQSAGEPKYRGLEISSARRLGDAVDPAALLFGRGKSEPELFLQSSREDAANGMTLPAGHARHLVDRCPFGQTQHRNHHVLLRGALQLRLRLGVRQGLDCRPQLIDQRIAVANFFSLFDIGQSVPQRQQPLGAERRCVQLLVRCKGNLAVVDCCRRSAAQRDPVVADDINAHEWGAPDRPGGGAAVTPLTLSSPTKASLFPIILWRCLAGSEHGITQPRPHDLRWVVRRAAGPKPLPHKPNTVVIRRAGYGALGRLDRVRGVRFLRLTCRAADGPAKPWRTPSGPPGLNGSHRDAIRSDVLGFMRIMSARAELCYWTWLVLEAA